MKNKKFRNGPLGALMDEYERAAEEIKSVILKINTADFISEVDNTTKDKDCISVQTIMNHVVRAGYGYSNYIRKHFGDPWTERKENYELSSPGKACTELDGMMNYTFDSFENKWNLVFDDLLKGKIKTHWWQEYDVEQMLEHAIVHILRHRRQIEKLMTEQQKSALIK